MFWSDMFWSEAIRGGWANMSLTKDVVLTFLKDRTIEGLFFSIAILIEQLIQNNWDKLNAFSISHFKNMTLFISIVALLYICSYLATKLIQIKLHLKLGKKDKELCELFSKNYPSDGNVALFLKTNDVRVSFKDDIITEIDIFCNSWNDVDHKFINKKLEKIKTQLLIGLDSYRKELIQYLDSNEAGCQHRFNISHIHRKTISHFACQKTAA